MMHSSFHSCQLSPFRERAVRGPIKEHAAGEGREGLAAAGTCLGVPIRSVDSERHTGSVPRTSSVSGCRSGQPRSANHPLTCGELRVALAAPSDFPPLPRMPWANVRPPLGPQRMASALPLGSVTRLVDRPVSPRLDLNRYSDYEERETCQRYRKRDCMKRIERTN
jgi:hypothetical protein